MSSTANAMWRIPRVLAGACRLSPWYALEPHDAVHPATFDGPLALQCEFELDEELGRGHEVVNHHADVIHPLDSHLLDGEDQALA